MRELRCALEEDVKEARQTSPTKFETPTYAASVESVNIAEFAELFRDL